MHQYGVTPPAVTAKMLQYTHLRYVLLFTRELCIWLTLFIVLQLGWGARLRDWCERLTAKPILRLAVYVTCLTAILTLLRLPYNLYANYYVEHSFGLSQQSVTSWLGDLLTERAVDIVSAVIGWGLAFAAINRFPRRWPVVLWAALTPVIAAMIFVYPLVVDPLFNKFTPMPASPMRSSIQRLAERAGIADAPVFVVDKSRQTSKLNAYVTGIGPSARVVIWDTTLKRLPEDQILAIIGHELGHYALGHVFIGFALTVVALLAGLLIAGRLQNWFISLLPKKWGVRGLTDLAIIPVLLLAGSILGFVIDPVDNAVSREIEHQADAFGLQLTDNKAAMARVFVSLSEQNLSEPDPPAFIQLWFFGHPSLRDRIDFALGINKSGEGTR